MNVENISEFGEEDLKIQTPGRLFVSGPSGSGKTSFVRDLLYNLDVFNKPVSNIVFCYGANQELYGNLRNNYPKDIKFVKGFSKGIEMYLNNPDQHDLLIIDDLIEEIADSKFFLQIFTKLSHHWNFSVITALHNPFFQSKYLRSCSLQATGFILFKTLRGRDQIQNLGRQLFPKNQHFIIESFDDATLEDFHYLFLNLSPMCKQELRVRGNILPYEDMTVYRPV